MQAGYLLEIVTDLGWCEVAGMGATVPLSFREIRAWSDLKRTSLDEWEVDAIRAASRAYCRQSAWDDPREPNFQFDETKPHVSAVRALAQALNKPKGMK